MVRPAHLSTTRHSPRVLDSSEESTSSSSPHSPGSIAFRDFSLAPLNAESTTTPADPPPSHPLLHISELHINPGEWVVVSGQSGAGKPLPQLNYRRRYTAISKFVTTPQPPPRGNTNHWLLFGLRSSWLLYPKFVDIP